MSINIFGGLVRRIEFRGLIEFADRDFNDFSFICVCIRLCLSLFFFYFIEIGWPSENQI